jgi:hypothetical protein
MRGKTVFLLLTFQCLWMTPGAHSSVPQDDLSAKLNKRVMKYDLGALNFVDAFLHVASDFQIPMGIAWVDTPAARAEQAFTWEETTVQEVIQAIAKTQPGYQVQIRNGVVHVSSPGLPPEAENFLSMKIKTFRVLDEYVEMANFKLHNLITPPNHAGFSVGANMEPKISLQLTNSTVEDILDALIVASACKMWVVTFSENSNLTPNGFRRTLALGNNLSPIPDKDQPGWELLHWGDKIIPGAARERK